MKKCLVCYEDADGDYHEKCSKQLFGTTTPPTLDIGPEDIEGMARETVNRRLTVPGVQKKLSLDFERDKDNLGRLTVVGALGGTYILKPPTAEYPEMPELENLTMHLAKKCGIRTASHGLIKMKDGSFAYITKRFDRSGKKKKIAVEDLCQLSELPSENKYKSTCEKAGKVIRKFSTNPGDDALTFFEIIVFSFLVGNSDMHLKNFSLMETKSGIIGMSPAYDLLTSSLLLEDHEESALQINGKKAHIKLQDFHALGRNLQIPQKVIDTCIFRQTKLLPSIQAEIAASFLSHKRKEAFSQLVASRCSRFLHDSSTRLV